MQVQIIFKQVKDTIEFFLFSGRLQQRIIVVAQNLCEILLSRLPSIVLLLIDHHKFLIFLQQAYLLYSEFFLTNWISRVHLMYIEDFWGIKDVKLFEFSKFDFKFPPFFTSLTIYIAQYVNSLVIMITLKRVLCFWNLLYIPINLLLHKPICLFFYSSNIINLAQNLHWLTLFLFSVSNLYLSWSDSFLSASLFLSNSFCCSAPPPFITCSLCSICLPSFVTV